ncbi:DUF1211 domain-containing protein [Lactococcus lactis subsp. lactis]|uniref:TMEM175 family protein n=1 Tax=Lactococcus lactis TaxID=1358 RepID=UPI0021B04F47|nr:TMEM175 family protein [Lactococcus lactis]MCT0017333.1 DUF1211 domain-containing protein [Lactococcus lactis subsp. lactis]
MNKERFLTFTDAIIAIIATLMVLEFKRPTELGIAALNVLVLPAVAYTLSFFLIMIVWFNHHQLYQNIEKISKKIFLYNTLWLFVMSFFPFTTGWVGAHLNDFLPEFLYILIVFLWSLVFHLMEHELRRENQNVIWRSMGVGPVILFGIQLLALSIVIFWAPIGILSVTLLSIRGGIQFIRK